MKRILCSLAAVILGMSVSFAQCGNVIESTHETLVVTSNGNFVTTSGSGTDCLDLDKDGVPNAKDKCPDLAGVLENGGCPADADQDGIYDSEDTCPQLAGVKENMGCPADTDKDGVYDADDSCPQVAGVKDNMGCPADSDKDGVYDIDDKCPQLAGLKELAGCPSDKDGDGVYDSMDKCPDVAGLMENKGCPNVNETTKKALTKALYGVQFETGSAIIKKTSYTTLDAVVKAMKEDPSFDISINGHTDNTGNYDKNVALSKARAQATKDYLVSKGVDPARIISVQGFGPDKPVADNATPEGRTKNRRVEFVVSY